jgi:hypothetical protein
VDQGSTYRIGLYHDDKCTFFTTKCDILTVSDQKQIILARNVKKKITD